MTKRHRRVVLEVLLLAMAFGEVNFDENCCTWVHIRRFRLPAGWNKAATELLIELPSAYPQVGPDGFYLDRRLRDRSGRTPAHYFEERGRYNKYADRGWAWFCLHQEPGKRGGWRAANSIMDGDNLIKYVELIRAILSHHRR